MLRRAVDVAIFAPLGALATLTAAVHRARQRPSTHFDDASEQPAPEAVVSDREGRSSGTVRGAPADLPIEGYDHLAASQVVDRLDGLTPAELDAVVAYERGHRHRQTVLAKVAQLRS